MPYKANVPDGTAAAIDMKARLTLPRSRSLQAAPAAAIANSPRMMDLIPILMVMVSVEFVLPSASAEGVKIPRLIRLSGWG